jgi:hypothetical protein
LIHALLQRCEGGGDLGLQLHVGDRIRLDVKRARTIRNDALDEQQSQRHRREQQ